MESEGQLMRVKTTLLLSVVKRGQTVYLKIPKSLNDKLGLVQGDAVQIAYIGKYYAEPSRPDPEEDRPE